MYLIWTETLGTSIIALTKKPFSQPIWPKILHHWNRPLANQDSRYSFESVTPSTCVTKISVWKHTLYSIRRYKHDGSDVGCCILGEGMDCCFGRTLELFDYDRIVITTYSSIAVFFCIFDLWSKCSWAKLHRREWGNYLFCDYVKAWANLFIRA